MTTIEVFSKDLKNLKKNMKSEIQKIAYSHAKTLLETVKKRSAVDTGFYRSQWRLSKARFFGDRLKIELKNDTPYLEPLIYGASKGEAPWYYPHRVKKGKKKGQFRKGTGKLFMKGGRVWAGGLKPGKNIAMYGAILDPVTDPKFHKQLMDDISNVIIKGI